MKSVSAQRQHTTLSGYQKKTVASAAFGFGLENMDIMFLSFALSSIIMELHLTPTQAGSISTVTNIGMLLGGVFFGVLADRFGRIKTLTYSILIFAFATGAMYFAHNLETIYALRFIAGIGGGGEYGIGMTVLAESFNKKNLGRISSVVAVAGQVGALAAAMLAMVILPKFGWHFLFLFGLIPVVLAFFIRSGLEESQSFKDNQDVQKGRLRDLFATKQLSLQTIALMWMAVVQIAGYFGLMNWLPTIMQAKLNLTMSGASSWMIATIIGMSAGMLTFGQILDRVGPRIAFGIFLIASAIAVYVLTLANGIFSLLLIGATVGYFSNGMFAGYGAIVSRLYPSEVRATANNAIMNVGRCIGGFSSLAIGFILQNYNMMTVMVFISTLYLLSFVVMLTVKNLRGKYYLNH